MMTNMNIGGGGGILLLWWEGLYLDCIILCKLCVCDNNTFSFLISRNILSSSLSLPGILKSCIAYNKCRNSCLY